MRPRLLLLLAVGAACASPAPAPQDENRSAIAISVRTNDATNQRYGYPQTVYFVKVDEDADPIAAGPVIKSNYRIGNIVCLLDAEPGRYVAVGGAERRDAHDWTSYFSAEMIPATEVTVGPRGFAFLGSYTIDIKQATVKPDAAQRHFERLISPGWIASKEVLKIFTRYRYFYGREFRPSPTAREDKARIEKHLSESGWGEWIRTPAR